MIRLQLQQIVSFQIKEYLQQEINKVDYYFAKTIVADGDKLDF